MDKVADWVDKAVFAAYICSRWFGRWRCSMTHACLDEGKPKLGVSGCLLGEMVRYNGGHARSRFVAQTLSKVFDWVPFCPEVAAGMGTPRETVRLVGDESGHRLLGRNSGEDWTERLEAAARRFLEMPVTRELHGFVLKSKSPSCGMARVPIYRTNGYRGASGQGLFTAALRKAFPLLPIEEEGRLEDARLREAFVIRVYVYKAWCDLLASGVTIHRLVAFHARRKLLLCAHHPGIARELGKLVARAGDRPLSRVVDEYGEKMTACLAKPPKHNYQVAVLERLTGFLRPHLDRADRDELLAAVAGYRRYEVPLSVPLILLRHHLRKNPHPWANEQTFLAPFPGFLPLRHFL